MLSSTFHAHSDLSSPCAVLRVCDVYDNIETNNTIQMVTELCTGQDLASYAANPVSEMKARPIVIQILVAVNYMHKRGVFHHNLSLENSKSSHWPLGIGAHYRTSYTFSNIVLLATSCVQGRFQ